MKNRDLPIKNTEEDKLNFSQFASKISKGILNYNQDETLIFSIEGEWGSGKTSLMNLIKDNLKNDVEILYFNPWLFTDLTQVIKLFFDELIKVLSYGSFKVKLREDIKKDLIKFASLVLPERTTGTTLRAEHGFTSIQLKELLNVNLNTVSEYSKINNNKLVELQNEIVKNDIKPKAFFKGKIINSSNSYMEQQIIKNPLAHILPDMGYCTYENKCGNHFDCLECEYLLPDINLLEFYRITALKQIEKSEFWTKKGNSIYQRDNLHRATLFTKLYEKSLLAKGEINDIK